MHQSFPFSDWNIFFLHFVRPTSTDMNLIRICRKPSKYAFLFETDFFFNYYFLNFKLTTEFFRFIYDISAVTEGYKTLPIHIGSVPGTRCFLKKADAIPTALTQASWEFSAEWDPKNLGKGWQNVE